MDKIEIIETNTLISKQKIIRKKKQTNKKFFYNIKRGKIKNAKNTKKISNPTFKIKKRIHLYIIIIVLFLTFIILFLYKNLFRKKYVEQKIEDNKILFNKTEVKDFDEQFNDIQNYMNLVLNGTVLDKDKIYYPSKEPKVSIVISAYNGEAFLKTTILSIQNQDLKDVEIVIVDDGSKDNTVNLVKELMKTEPRIVLYENGENKGSMFTKTRGILLAKGKYVMTLDEDDIYTQRDAFSYLYEEAEKNNIDILKFIFRHSGARIPRYGSSYGNKTGIITQPELSNFMYYIDSKGRVKQNGGNLVNVFVRTKIFKKAISLIDEKNLNTKMLCHEDFILFFLLTRTANNLKCINRLFYAVLHTWKNSNPKIKERNEIKGINMKNNKCFAFINFLEILFKNTKNTVEDKKIAFSQLETWYLRNYCRSNKDSREKAIEVFKLYLGCEYISNEDKKKIQNFINSS